MTQLGRMSKEEWEALEPLLAEVDADVHRRFINSNEVRTLIGDSEHSPGYLLLRRLKELNDDLAIHLFRAMEMYHHELTRANIQVAYLMGKKANSSE